jgi:hypothetical protein
MIPRPPGARNYSPLRAPDLTARSPRPLRETRASLRAGVDGCHGHAEGDARNERAELPRVGAKLPQRAGGAPPASACALGDHLGRRSSVGQRPRRHQNGTTVSPDGEGGVAPAVSTNGLADSRSQGLVDLASIREDSPDSRS